MGMISARVGAVSTYLWECIRRGLPEYIGREFPEVVFLVDGVGGFQFGVVLVRRALRLAQAPLGTLYYRWQFGLPGDVLTDLMWLRRNRLMGAKLARKLRAFRRAHPDTKVHLLAYSGGAGVAVFACERIQRRPIIDTLVLACPAISPCYNLGPALRAVKRCYALVSCRDSGILGVGTRLFGTTDRRFCRAAGMVGFRKPADLGDEDKTAYQKIREIVWTPSLKKEGHYGGHTGWVNARLLQRHLPPILCGAPLLPTREVAPA